MPFGVGQVPRRPSFQPRSGADSERDFKDTWQAKYLEHAAQSPDFGKTACSRSMILEFTSKTRPLTPQEQQASTRESINCYLEKVKAEEEEARARAMEEQNRRARGSVVLRR